MGKKLNLRYESPQGYFSLTSPDYGGGGMGHDDETYQFVLHILRSYRTGEIAGFSNEGGELARDYEYIMQLLTEKPIPERYDVPQLGLRDAPLDEIITAIYRRFVLGESVVEYPTAEERERPLPTVAEEPTDLE
jgi:hypothetical protein